jgi:tricorn protease
MYSPLSDRVLRLTGQQGLLPGDIIIGVNAESVMNAPSINMFLRGKAGESVRLEVQRVTSKSKFTELRKAKMRLLQNNNTDEVIPGPEPLVVVPLSATERDNLIYAAWEWKTRERAKALAAEAGFTLGYIHLQDMSGAPAEDAFARGFYPDHDKQALIVDVRHNSGGNIDSWLLDTLQRKAWMYWQGREDTDGGLMWDEQFAFRGHLIVLIDEKTSSDAEAFARGVSELGLGKLLGKRTWGGGIWFDSDNTLVDGGITTAPEVGVFNDKYGWGLGIEQMGVVPDIEVDNNPRDAYEGRDTQLEVAISVLKEWLQKEAVVMPKNPGRPKNMSKRRKDSEGCSV